MIPAAHIKRNIDFNARFRGLLEVLKLVAVAQYYQLEKQLKTFDRLQTVLGQFFDMAGAADFTHPFLVESRAPMGVLAVTSDAGLLGGLNNQVMMKAFDLVGESNGRLIVVGEKGQSYAQDARIPATFFPGVSDSERYRQALEIRDFLTQNVLSGALGSVKVVYPRAVSFVIHRVITETLVPFSRPEKQAAPAASRPAGRGGSEEIIFESTPEETLEYLVYICLGQRLFEVFGMSRLAEQAARFTHLEESCQKILDMNKKLLLQYFRRRHEMIDQNMRELFAARSLYAK